MGGAVKSVKKAAGSLVGGGVRNLLFGKEQTIGADPLAPEIRDFAAKGLRSQSRLIKEAEGMHAGVADKAILAGARKQQDLLRGAAADQRRQLQESIARKGLGRSSLALTAGKDITKNLGTQLADIERQIPYEQYKARLGNLQARSGIINPIVASQKVPVQMRDVNLGRKGGISGILGAGVGGMVGGPQGAMAGMQIGQGLGGVFG